MFEMFVNVPPLPKDLFSTEKVSFAYQTEEIPSASEYVALTSRLIFVVFVKFVGKVIEIAGAITGVVYVTFIKKRSTVNTLVEPESSKTIALTSFPETKCANPVGVML